MKIKLPVAVLSAVFMVGSIFLFSYYVRGEHTDIVITEIGAYESNDHEWIEIYNKGNEPVNIDGWKFLVEGESEHGIKVGSGTNDFVLDAQSYAIIAENDLNFVSDYPGYGGKLFDSSWGSINEDGSKKIGLKTNDGTTLEFFNYPAAPDFSLERKDVQISADTIDNWKEHPNGNTVGQQNYWAGTSGEEENNIPIAVIQAVSNGSVEEEIVFNASQSHDDDGTISRYVWDFGDLETAEGVSVVHTYNQTGIFNVKLDVYDNAGAMGSVTHTITIQGSSPTSTEDIPTSTIPYTAGIMINEFVSDPVSDQKEWIELYNASTSTIDMTGWELHDGVGKIASADSTLSAGSFMLIQLSSSKLNNNGDAIALKTPDGSIVDMVRFGDWTDAGDENIDDNAPKPGKGNACARMVDGQQTGNNHNDFSETTTPTPSEHNVITTPVTNPTPSGGGGSSSQQSTPTRSYNPRDVVINELVSDPQDGEDEFVELYNTTDASIELSSWWIEDGGETKTQLSGTISSHGFFVIEKPKGSLNNSGDLVALFDLSGKEIDRAAYGMWDDGNVADNARAPSDPLSLARKVDGQDADNDYYDFVLTSTITKGTTNIISSVTEDGEVIEQIVGTPTIIINEILPNPNGDDGEDEFIELYNSGSATVNIQNWKLGDASAKRYIITQGVMQPKSYLVFKRSMTGIALNNTGGDEVKLFGPSGALMDSTKYPGSAPEVQTYSRREEGGWVWTTKATPGVANIIEGASAAPTISIDTESEVAVNQWVVFDASDTIDPEGATLIFHWDFGDGTVEDGAVIEHKFMQEGIYTVTLTVDNGKKTSTKEMIVTVKLSSDFVGGYAGGDSAARIQISEIVPNPEGSDTTEYIELFNPTDESIDLSGLKLDDEDGGSRAYTMPNGTLIQPKEYKVFGKQDTKLSLNNTSDSVRLLYPDGSVVNEVRYDDVLEAHAFVRNDEGEWVWTSELTPGAANFITAPKEVKSVKVKSSKINSEKQIIDTSLEKLRLEDIGDQVRVTGIVAVEPGVLGTQFFYIVNGVTDASSTPAGVQVYMYTKDFPDLVVGDRVEITGELSETSGEVRIKLKEKSDIKKLEFAGEPHASSVDIAQIGEGFEGALVQVNGEITEIKGSYMYVDDGTEEVKVYFKSGAGIKKDTLQEGDLVMVTGLLHQTKTEYQLLPRTMTDILKTGVTEEFVSKAEQEKKESAEDVAEKYLTATAGGLTALFMGLLGKTHGGRAVELGRKMLDRVKKRRRG